MVLIHIPTFIFPERSPFPVKVQYTKNLSGVSVLQLEARHRLHRPAVRAVLQRRERTQQEEHPGQQSALLPLLHTSLRTRVTRTAVAIFASSHALEMLSEVHVVLQAASGGYRVHEGPAGQS